MRLDQSLGDHIREAPVRRGGVGVVLYRQAEVSLLRIPRTLQNIFTRPDQLDHRQ